MSREAWFERSVTVLLTLSAVAMASAVVYKEAKSGSTSATPAALRPPQYYPEWNEILRVTRAVGDTDRRVRVVEFTDLECPACRQFHRTTLPAVRERYGQQIAEGVVHRPLRIHRLAKQAALSAECAAKQDAFAPFVELTFAKQDSIGLKPWSSFALEAGVTDTGRFAACLRDNEADELVAAGSTLADRLRINSTPTVFVNGWRLAQASEEELTRVIDDLLAGRKPSIAERSP